MKCVFLFLILSQSALAYTLNMQSDGTYLKWPETSKQLYLIPSSVDITDESIVESIVRTSVNEWNNSSNFNTSLIVTNDRPAANRNDLYFNSSNPLYLGSAVVGVTNISFKNDTGEIIEADIIINDDLKNISSDTNTIFEYLGDVISHELGHFQGLSHSAVMGSTMYFQLKNGQDLLHTDDIAGSRHLYGPSNKVISGVVQGGSNSPIFGAHVQAVSRTTGKIIASSITDENGNFSIQGLDSDDYLIYTSPLSDQGSLTIFPDYYDSIKKNFCTSRNDFRGSFAQTCRASDEGFPQIYSLENVNSLDVGTISIRCNLDVPVEYIQDKTNFEMEVVKDYFGTKLIGERYVGYFSQSDLISQTSDSIAIDLSSYTWTDINSSNGDDLYLEVKVSNQSFYSLFRNVITITRGDGASVKSEELLSNNIDSEGNYDIDSVLRISLDFTDITRTTFTVDVKPETTTDAGIVTENVFPGYLYNSEELAFYLLQADIVAKQSDGSYTRVSTAYRTYEDNAQCLDAAESYSITSNDTQSNVSASFDTNKSVEVAACGSVAFVDDNDQGPKSMFMLLSAILIITYLRRSTINI